MADHKSYKAYLKSDSPYLGEWDLPYGNDVVLTIEDVKDGDVVGPQGIVSKGMVIYFKEDVKPLFCNITNAKMIEHIYKTRFVDEWIGKHIQLYVDENIKFGKNTLRGIRIRNFEPKTEKAEYKCSVCGKEIDENTFKASMAKYGKALCSKECLEKDKNGFNVL